MKPLQRPRHVSFVGRRQKHLWARRQDLAVLSRLRPGEESMEQDRAFVEAIRAQPEDDTLRLVYSDWLKDRGDPRGDFIEAQVRWQQAHEALDVAAMKHHAARDWPLQRQHRAAWLAPLEALGLQHAEFRRGFVEAGGIKLADFLKNAGNLFELAPLLHDLGIYEKGPDLLPRLAEYPLLGRLDAVTFWGSPILATTLGTFASSPHAVNLRSLHLREVRLFGPDIPAACVQLLALPQLTRFAFTGNGVCPRGPRQRLRPTPIGDEVVAALAQSPNLSRLRLLAVTFSRAITDAAVAALAGSPYLACSEGLDLSQTAITDAGAQALADSPRSACLTTLNMMLAGVGNAGLEALLQSPHLGALRNLTIGSLITDPGVRALANAPASSRLRRLDLSYNRQLGVAGAEALAASEHLTNLQELGLRETRIGPRGALAVVHSTHLPGLRLLHVGTEGGRWERAIWEAIEKRFG
jgi:uncharacterized protein (TIGR02996 family)